MSAGFDAERHSLAITHLVCISSSSSSSCWRWCSQCTDADRQRHVWSGPVYRPRARSSTLCTSMGTYRSIRAVRAATRPPARRPLSACPSTYTPGIHIRYATCTPDWQSWTMLGSAIVVIRCPVLRRDDTDPLMTPCTPVAADNLSFSYRLATDSRHWRHSISCQYRQLLLMTECRRCLHLHCQL